MLLDLALDDGTLERKHVLVQFVVLLLVQVKQLKQVSQRVLVQFVRVLLMPVKACQREGREETPRACRAQGPASLALPC